MTLVNLSATEPRTVIVQAGGYAEHQFDSVEWNGRTERLDARDVTVRLAPGRRRHADARDAPLRQYADGGVSVGSLDVAVRGFAVRGLAVSPRENGVKGDATSQV